LSKQFFHLLAFFIQNAAPVVIVDQDASIPESFEERRSHSLPQGRAADIDI
jgi:hypothetical protein